MLLGKLVTITALIFILLISIGGYFWPVLGLVVPLMILTAFVSAAATKKKRFCSIICPRAKGLNLLRRFSAYRKLPSVLTSKVLTQSMCALMMLCSIMQITRLHPSFAGIEYLGRFFWGMCVATLAAALIMALIFKPRAWCAVCPMGTLQSTVIGKPEENKHQENA